MSNVEHLFENALLALENDYNFREWKRTQTDMYNTDGVSEEVIEAIWELAIYTKYTYEPSLNAIPVEWIKKYYADITSPYTDTRIQFEEMIRKWEKENEDGALVTLEDNERWEEQEDLDMQMVIAEGGE